MQSLEREEPDAPRHFCSLHATLGTLSEADAAGPKLKKNLYH